LATGAERSTTLRRRAGRAGRSAAGAEGVGLATLIGWWRNGRKRAEPRPGWVDELAELLQKSLRAQARLAITLEDLERKVEGGFEDLRRVIAEAARGAEGADSGSWDDVLDALDVLGHAMHEAGDPRLRAGLWGIEQRLERVLARAGFVRHGAPGAPPDGRICRVVGSEPRADLPAGVVARVVRAAVTRGGRVVREGDVVVSRSAGDEG
jgi:molecular chaperone GrpE (heat shock protein)